MGLYTVLLFVEITRIHSRHTGPGLKSSAPGSGSAAPSLDYIVRMQVY